jgi:hypothetical protein
LPNEPTLGRKHLKIFFSETGFLPSVGSFGKAVSEEKFGSFG